MALSKPTHEWFPNENILHVKCPPSVSLTTREEIDEHFANIEAIVRLYCQKGHKVNYIICYDDFVIDPAEVDAYGEHVKRISEQYLLYVVRYGGGSLQRTSSRLSNMKAHVPSNLYSTEEEAFRVMRALIAGKTRASTLPPPAKS